MSVVLRLSGHAPLRCRFAVSPLGELNEALRSLNHPDRESYHLPWQRQVRPALDGLGLDPLLALMPPLHYQPDFMCPPPTGPHSDIGSDLARLRANDPSQVEREIQRCLSGQRRDPARQRLDEERFGDPVATLALVADLLERAWGILIGPWWPQLRDVLDADVTVRARQLADAGVAVVLNDLHPRIRWRAGEVRVAVGADADVRTLTDDGIVLMPSVFAWPGVGVMLDPPWQPTITYPARGIAQIWQPAPRQSGDLARLVGATRATILMALVEPASTTGLAARCDLPKSSVSEHLSVLRATGLVATVRTGRFLLHQRTALGVALAGVRSDRPPSAD